MVKGTVTMQTTISDGVKSCIEDVTFLVIYLALSYNVIFGAPTMVSFVMVTSLPYQRIKFSTDRGNIALRNP